MQRMASLWLHVFSPCMPDGGVVLSCPVPVPSGSSQVHLHHAGSVLVPPAAPPAIGSVGVATHGPQRNRRYKYARAPLMCFLLSVWLGIQYSLPLSVCMHACQWAIMAHANQLGWAQINQLHIPIFILSSLQLRQNHLPYDIEFL